MRGRCLGEHRQHFALRLNTVSIQLDDTVLSGIRMSRARLVHTKHTYLWDRVEPPTSRTTEPCRDCHTPATHSSQHVEKRSHQSEDCASDTYAPFRQSTRRIIEHTVNSLHRPSRNKPRNTAERTREAKVTTAASSSTSFLTRILGKPSWCFVADSVRAARFHSKIVFQHPQGRRRLPTNANVGDVRPPIWKGTCLGSGTKKTSDLERKPPRIWKESVGLGNGNPPRRPPNPVNRRQSHDRNTVSKRLAEHVDRISLKDWLSSSHVDR